jgi:hypothetical protein
VVLKLLRITNRTESDHGIKYREQREPRSMHRVNRSDRDFWTLVYKIQTLAESGRTSRRPYLPLICTNSPINRAHCVDGGDARCRDRLADGPRVSRLSTQSKHNQMVVTILKLTITSCEINLAMVYRASASL